MTRTDAGTACLVLLSALVAGTCASRGELAGPAAAGPTPPRLTSSGSIASAPTPTSPAAADSAAPLHQDDGRDAELLATFHRALQALAAGERDTSVRVLWLGDSHTFADFWPATLRRAWGTRYGKGGPGFLHGASATYGRAGARVDVTGKWRREPKAPARTTPDADGVFGVAGTRYIPRAGARVRVELGAGSFTGSARFEVLFRLRSRGDDFKLRSGESTWSARAAVRSGETQGSEGGVQRWPLTLTNPELELYDVRGRPELYGIIAEGTQPGVVIDNLGINGARAATPLAWDVPTFVEHVKARAPELFVLAYGTNEVVADFPPERLRATYRELLGRLREGSEHASCVLAGPTDLVKGSVTHPRVEAIDQVQRDVARELGCVYFSSYDVMRSTGGMASWQVAAPPLGRPDGIHLTPAGYEQLGLALLDVLSPPGS